MRRVYGVPKADEESESAAYDSRRDSWDQRRQIKTRFQAMIRRQDAGQERLVSLRRRGEAMLDEDQYWYVCSSRDGMQQPARS